VFQKATVALCCSPPPRILLFVATLLLCNPALANVGSGSAELTEPAKAILDNVAVSLSEHPQLRLEIAGHTDAQGSADFNQALSQNRAEAVREYLIGQGENEENLSAKGYGEAQPLADNASNEGRAKNRRVELNRL